MSTIRSDARGFTLVELVMAIGIGGIFIIAVITLNINNNRIAQRTRDVAVTNSYVENKVEALRSAGYLSLNNGTTSITSELPGELKAPRSGSIAVSSAAISVKKIAISVTYNEQGTPRTYKYTTYIGELGVGQY